MKPNKFETAVQCSVCYMEDLAGFSSHDNSINIKYVIVYDQIVLKTFFLNEKTAQIRPNRAS